MIRTVRGLGLLLGTLLLAGAGPSSVPRFEMRSELFDRGSGSWKPLDPGVAHINAFGDLGVKVKLSGESSGQDVSVRVLENKRVTFQGSQRVSALRSSAETTHRFFFVPVPSGLLCGEVDVIVALAPSGVSTQQRHVFLCGE